MYKSQACCPGVDKLLNKEKKELLNKWWQRCDGGVWLSMWMCVGEKEAVSESFDSQFPSEIKWAVMRPWAAVLKRQQDRLGMRMTLMAIYTPACTLPHTRRLAAIKLLVNIEISFGKLTVSTFSISLAYFKNSICCKKSYSFNIHFYRPATSLMFDSQR